MTTAQVQPTASQSMLKECRPSGVAQSSVHSTWNEAWCTSVPWQCSRSSRHSRQTSDMSLVVAPPTDEALLPRLNTPRRSARPGTPPSLRSPRK